MVMGKKVTWIVLFLLMLSSVSAIAFEVTISPESKIITSSEKAEFALTVEHEAQQTQYFEIYSSDVQWDLSTIPSTDRVLEVPKGRNKTTKLVLRPLYAATGAYVVDVTVKLSGTNDFIKKNIQTSTSTNSHMMLTFWTNI